MKPETIRLAKMAACMLLAACSGTPRAASPQLGGAIRGAADVTETISLVQDDAKEVKEFHRQSMSLVDRLDYKTQILLR